MNRKRGLEWPTVRPSNLALRAIHRNRAMAAGGNRRHGMGSVQSRPSTICVMRPLGTAPTWVASTLPPLNTIMVGTPRTL